jgi:hypothetical protein
MHVRDMLRKIWTPPAQPRVEIKVKETILPVYDKAIFQLILLYIAQRNNNEVQIMLPYIREVVFHTCTYNKNKFIINTI